MIMSGYGRVSTDEEKQLDSLQHQKEFFADFAASHNHVLYHVYADEGISGKQLKKRDDFNNMLKDAGLGLFDLVVVKDVSRFARNTVDLLTSVRKLKALGIEILFLGNNQKVLGESEFVLTILGAVAQEESANLSRRVKFGKKINAKKGRVPPRIFGYDRIDNFTLQINENEAEVVREIYRLYITEGMGCRKIALALDDEHAKTKFGMQWNPRGVRRVLCNPIYCGKYVNHKYEITDFIEGTQKVLPKEENFEHNRPDWEIVSPDTYAEAQIVMNSRRKTYENEYTHMTGRHSSRHLFSTLIYCEQCGRAFSRRSYTYAKTRIYWKCTTNNQYTAARCDNNITIDEDELIQKISEYLYSLVAEKDAVVKRLLATYHSDNCKKLKQDDGEALQGRRNKLQKQKEKYQEMYANDIISMTELRSKTAEIAKHISRIDGEISGQNAERIKVKSTEETINIAFDEIDKFLSLESATNSDLKKIISAIMIDRDGVVKIHLKIEQTIGTKGKDCDMPICGQQ